MARASYVSSRAEFGKQLVRDVFGISGTNVEDIM